MMILNSPNCRNHSKSCWFVFAGHFSLCCCCDQDGGIDQSLDVSSSVYDWTDSYTCFDLYYTNTELLMYAYDCFFAPLYRKLEVWHRTSEGHCQTFNSIDVRRLDFRLLTEGGDLTFTCYFTCYVGKIHTTSVVYWRCGFRRLRF